MTDSGLKVVVSFDHTTNVLNLAGHNLNTKKAEQLAAGLKQKGFQIKILDQPERHTGRSFKACAPCQSTVQTFSAQDFANEDPDEESEEN